MTNATPTPGNTPGLHESAPPCAAQTNPTLSAVHRRALRLDGLVAALWEVAPLDAAGAPAYALAEVCRAEARALTRELSAILDRDEVLG